MTWTDRSVLVTGAGGFIGSWLTRRLVDDGADVVALVPDLDARSEFVRGGLVDRVTVVPGVLEDPDAVARAIIGHEVDTVFHLGAQTIVGAAQRDPVATFEANVRGTYLLLDACRRAGDLVTRGRRRLERQGLRHRGRAPVHGGHAARRAGALRGLEDLHRPPRAVVRRELRPARGGGAVRQRLRRRRSQLESDRARHHPRSAAGRDARDPQRRHVRARLPPRRRRRRRLPRAGVVARSGLRRRRTRPKTASRSTSATNRPAP